MKKALIQLHVAIFLAGFTAILGKLIGLNEGLIVWYRLLLTVLTLGLILFFRKQLERIPLKDALKICGEVEFKFCTVAVRSDTSCIIH